MTAARHSTPHDGAYHGNLQRDYSSLSVYDLLLARDARHAQYARNPNVIGTAIGRYLIRKGEEHVRVGRDADVATIEQIRAKGASRTAATASVTRDSWPCVLVFVRKLLPPDQVHPSDYIEPFIVIETDRPPRVIVAPVCIVESPLEPAAARAFDVQTMPPSPVGGGYPIFTNVQGRRHTGTIACIVTDGRSRYALTNRHVAGPTGTEVYPSTSFRSTRLGITSESIGRLPFNAVWPMLPLSRSTSPVDAALLELDDADDITAKIFRPLERGGTTVPGGALLGPIVNIDELALDLDWIGRELNAFGAVSGTMRATILGLLYRYIDEGGTDYTCDVLLTSDDGTATMRPGDSGTLWTYIDHANRQRPFALQWGGEHHRFNYGNQVQTFALATFLSNATRALNVRVETDLNVEGPEYWGQTGHFIIGDLTPDFVRDGDLRAFFAANRELISNNPKDPWTATKPADFVGLADVPDIVWRNTRMKTEGPNHYIDLDLTGFDKLKDITVSEVLTRSDYDPQAVQDLYDDANADPNRPPDSHHKGKLKTFDGMLPWRVGQLFNIMVDAVAQGDLNLFFVAAGTCAHYTGDGCQPLHGAKWTNGRPGEPPGAHAMYEDTMLDDNDAFDESLRAYVKTNLPKRDAAAQPISTGKSAAKMVHELLESVQSLMPPTEILNLYQKLLKKHAKPNGTHDKVGIARDMWDVLGPRTLEAMFNGCDTLAFIWESAWKTGIAKAGATPPDLTVRSAPVKIKPAKLTKLVADFSVCQSFALDKMISTPELWK